MFRRTGRMTTAWLASLLDADGAIARHCLRSEYNALEETCNRPV